MLIKRLSPFDTFLMTIFFVSSVTLRLTQNIKDPVALYTYSVIVSIGFLAALNGAVEKYSFTGWKKVFLGMSFLYGLVTIFFGLFMSMDAIFGFSDHIHLELSWSMGFILLLWTAVVLCIGILGMLCMKRTVPNDQIFILNGAIYRPGEQYRKLWFLNDTLYVLDKTTQIYTSATAGNLRLNIIGTFELAISKYLQTLDYTALVKELKKCLESGVLHHFLSLPYNDAIEQISHLDQQPICYEIWAGIEARLVHCEV